jgi:hypothetical protein
MSRGCGKTTGRRIRISQLCEPAEQLKHVVVMNSCTALRWAASRVRKIWRYHGLIMMLRQSRASLSAKS